jgi:hypothetical protein
MALHNYLVQKNILLHQLDFTTIGFAVHLHFFFSNLQSTHTFKLIFSPQYHKTFYQNLLLPNQILHSPST